LAAAHSRHGHIDRARPLLDQAIGIYERLGATTSWAQLAAAAAQHGAGQLQG
jgi:hypothetical protein